MYLLHHHRLKYLHPCQQCSDWFLVFLTIFITIKSGITGSFMSKGSVPFVISVPSEIPSPSVSATSGSVKYVLTSAPSLSPSLSLSESSGSVFSVLISTLSLSPSESLSEANGFV